MLMQTMKRSLQQITIIIHEQIDPAVPSSIGQRELSFYIEFQAVASFCKFSQSLTLSGSTTTELSACGGGSGFELCSVSADG